MRTTVLLTGASGFVGAQILQKLMDFDCEVSIVLRAPSTNPLFGSDKIKRVFYTDNFFKENEDWFKSILKDIDIVIHAAWFAKPKEYLESKINFECINGSLEFARIAKICEVKRFIGIGTCLEYDLSEGIVSVNTALKPISLYARAKAQVYDGILKNLIGSRTQFSWCRLFSLFGENEHHDRLVPYVREKLRNGEKVQIHNGSYIRDYLDVKIAGAQIAQVAMSNFIGPVNICSGVPISIKELVINLSHEYGSAELLIFDELATESTGYPYIVGIPNWKLNE
jgi:dTDP-6-deoxy-L-talose 4-dehydrogenase (NAD+)